MNINPIRNNSQVIWNYAALPPGSGGSYADLGTNYMFYMDFDTADLKTGVYQGLELTQVDKEGDGFAFSLNIGGRSLDFWIFWTIFKWVVFFSALVYQIFEFLINRLRFRINFAYNFSRFVVLISLVMFLFFGYEFPAFSLLMGIYIFEIWMVTLLHYHGTSKTYFYESLWLGLKTRFISMAISIGLIVALLWHPEYYLMVVLVPPLMAWFDRFRSYDFQRPIYLFFRELPKILLIVFGSYMPSYVLHPEGNLITEFNLEPFLPFIFVMFVVIPVLFFFLHHPVPFKFFTLRGMKLRLKRVELHGKRKHNPVLVLDGMGNQIEKQKGFLGFEFPALYAARKVPLFRPSSFSGVVEVVMNRSKRGELIVHKKTEFVDFFRFRKTKSPSILSFSQQSCHNENFRRTFRFQVCEKGLVTTNATTGILVTPVETPEATLEHKFVAMFYSNKSKFKHFKADMKEPGDQFLSRRIDPVVLLTSFKWMG